jgi:hypothetical protein
VVHAGHQGAARRLIEIEHHVAQEDHVEEVGSAMEWQR